MKNVNDYEAGWTTSLINPATGKKVSGGAARNHRTKQAGGAHAIYNVGAINAIQQMQPIIDRYEVTIARNTETMEAMRELLVQQQVILAK
jgi:hypothetical protein